MPTDAAEIAEVLGGREVLGSEIRTFADLERVVMAGLPKAALRRVAEIVFPDARRRRQLIYAVVPEASYKRRRQYLSAAESARAERLARVVAAARAVWGEGEDLSRFLTTPHPLLEGRTPLEAARSEIGARRVEQILAALEWGLPV